MEVSAYFAVTSALAFINNSVARDNSLRFLTEHASSRYYDLDGVWYKLATKWDSGATNNMVSSDMTYGGNEYMGGGYFESFLVWWWVPAITSIIAIGLMPHVPYAKRVGTQNGSSGLIRKVCSYTTVLLLQLNYYVPFLSSVLLLSILVTNA